MDTAAITREARGSHRERRGTPGERASPRDLGIRGSLCGLPRSLRSVCRRRPANPRIRRRARQRGGVAHRLPFHLPLDDVSLEFLDVPGAVHLEMRAKLKDAPVLYEERTSLNREQHQGPLLVGKMLAEQRKAVRIPLRAATEPKHCRPFERVGVAHRATDRTAGDEGSLGGRTTSTLKLVVRLTWGGSVNDENGRGKGRPGTRGFRARVPHRRRGGGRRSGRPGGM